MNPKSAYPASSDKIKTMFGFAAANAVDVVNNQTTLSFSRASEDANLKVGIEEAESWEGTIS
jgi:hypothetical protein